MRWSCYIISRFSSADPGWEKLPYYPKTLTDAITVADTIVRAGKGSPIVVTVTDPETGQTLYVKASARLGDVIPESEAT